MKCCENVGVYLDMAAEARIACLTYVEMTSLILAYLRFLRHTLRTKQHAIILANTSPLHYST